MILGEPDENQTGEIGLDRTGLQGWLGFGGMVLSKYGNGQLLEDTWQGLEAIFAIF